MLTGAYLLVSGVTEIGRATERTLAFNDPGRRGPLVARHIAILDRVYPPAWARGWGY